jgi:hypothetical protein
LEENMAVDMIIPQDGKRFRPVPRRIAKSACELPRTPSLPSIGKKNRENLATACCYRLGVLGVLGD